MFVLCVKKTNIVKRIDKYNKFTFSYLKKIKIGKLVDEISADKELILKIKNTKIQIVNRHKPIKKSIDNITPKEVAIPFPPLNLSQIGKQCPKTKK